MLGETSDFEYPQRPWSPGAVELIDFVYRFWVENRRAPNFLDIHAALNLSPQRTRRLFRELEEGFALTSRDHLIGFSIDKAPPFSATPTTVAAFTGGRFLSYVGCPMEGLTIGALPPLERETLTLKSFCGCCCEPIELEVRGQEILSAKPARPLICIVRSPHDWEGGVSSEVVCDSFHYVLDADHAQRFEHRVARRGTTMTLDQATEMTATVAAHRMRDPHFPQIRIEGKPTIEFLAGIGVDADAWRA